MSFVNKHIGLSVKNINNIKEILKMEFLSYQKTTWEDCLDLLIELYINQKIY